MRFFCVALLMVPWPGQAWDTAPHQRITKAAIDSLPERYRNRLGPEAAALIQIYCMYPDRYLEMERYGFARKSAGPRTASEIKAYCVRQDGVIVHGASGDREEDRASLVFLFERVMSGLSENRVDEAAKYAGVLSHFFADSLSPPHSVDAEALADLAPGVGAGSLHAAIERSLPEFVLAERRPRGYGTLLAAIDGLLDECYAGAAENRRDLGAMVKAVASRDEVTLDGYRLRAGRRAAGILADALMEIFRVAQMGSRRI